VTERAVNSSEGPEATSLTLLERARASDQSAWERLVSLYEPLVSRWCRRSGLQEADVADVRQEVFGAVSGALKDFRRDVAGGTFRGWLRRITQHKVYDHLRRRAREPAAAGGSEAHELLAELPAGEETVPGATDPEEASLLYRRALALIATDFEEHTWKAFWRVVIDDQRPREVALELGMTQSAVSHAKARVLSRLREEFTGLLEV
jgi:RNA polymerase sigma-70 factor (ECF subfamily)